MKEFGNLNVLNPQLFTEEEEKLAIINTMTLDYSFGSKVVVDSFSQQNGNCKPWISLHYNYLKSLSSSELEAQAAKAKPNSLLMTPIMLTGECNANCEVCYTDRKKKPNELKWHEIKEIIDQTRLLGSRTIYIAGEGEPTLDPNLFQIFDYATEIGMDILLFTNGLLLSNDELCRRRLGITSVEFVERIAKAPVYIYHKFWSTDPIKNQMLMRLSNGYSLNYSKFRINGSYINIPTGLELLLKSLPRERIGIETYVEKRTAEEVMNTIVPFIEKTGVKSYVEPLIHSGKNFNSHEFDPDYSQIQALQPWLVRQGCTRVAYIFAVHNNGYATPGISILNEHLKLAEKYEDLNIRNSDGTIKDLHILRHTHPFLIKNRYRISGCLCEEFNLEVANKISKYNG